MANAQLLEGRGKLKTADKEKRASSKYEADKNIKKNKGRGTSYPKKKVRYSERSDYNAPQPKVKYGKADTDDKRAKVFPKYSIKGDNTKRISVSPKFSRILTNTKREEVNPKYSVPIGSSRRTEVNPKYSTPSNNEKRQEVYPKYSKPSNSTKRIEVNPRYSVKGKVKREEVYPRYSVRAKEKRIEVNPRYSVRDKEKRIEVNPRYSRDIGFKNTKKVIPRSITGQIKDEKYDVQPRYSIYEPFDVKKYPPLSISAEGMVFDNTKERKKNAVRNDPKVAEFSGFDSWYIPFDSKKSSLYQSKFSGFDERSVKKEKSNQKKIASRYKDFVGPYQIDLNDKGVGADINAYLGPSNIKPLKRKKNMHPSAAYLGSENTSNKKMRELKRELNIAWVRLNGNKNIPDNVKDPVRKKTKRDKKEGEIWVY